MFTRGTVVPVVRARSLLLALVSPGCGCVLPYECLQHLATVPKLWLHPVTLSASWSCPQPAATSVCPSENFSWGQGEAHVILLPRSHVALSHCILPGLPPPMGCQGYTLGAGGLVAAKCLGRVLGAPGVSGRIPSIPGTDLRGGGKPG